jgi:transcription elongation factor Elf1
MAKRIILTQTFKCPCCNKSITTEVRKNQRETIRESKERLRKFKTKSKPEKNTVQPLTTAYEILVEKCLREAKISSLVSIKCPRCEKYLHCWINKVTGEVDNLKESTDLGFTNEFVGNLVIDDPFFGETM